MKTHKRSYVLLKKQNVDRREYDNHVFIFLMPLLTAKRCLCYIFDPLCNSNVIKPFRISSRECFFYRWLLSIYECSLMAVGSFFRFDFLLTTAKEYLFHLLDNFRRCIFTYPYRTKRCINRILSKYLLLRYIS